MSEWVCECASCDFTSSFGSISQCQFTLHFTANGFLILWTKSAAAKEIGRFRERERGCVRFASTLHGFAHSDETKSDKISSLWLISRNFSPSARHVHSHISTLLNYSIIFTWTCILLSLFVLPVFFFCLPWRIEFCCHHNSHAIIVVRSRVSLLPIFFSIRVRY